MKPRDISFIVGILVVVGILFYLSSTGKKPPDIPPDRQHMTATTKEDCQACHAEGKANPLKPTHPPKDQCPECHRLKRAGHGANL